MIIAEERFIKLFDTQPSIIVAGSSYKPQYDFGSYTDLLKYLNLKAKEGGKVYPLIWLETPITLEGDFFKKGKFKFILATLSKTTLSNRERLEITINPALVPLKNNLVSALKQSGFTRFVNTENNKEAIHYNVGLNETSDKSPVDNTPDIWDAIKFECELEITNCEQKNINY